MTSSSGSFNITNELYKRSRQPCNKIATCIRKFAEKKTAEWPYVNKKVPLSGTVKSTFIVAFSSDDTLMASTHGDHHVRVTDVRTQECKKTLIGHPRTPWCVTFHPSSNQILASGCLGGEVRVWDLHGGSEVWISEHHTTIASLSFHPLDQVLAIATSNQIFLWKWSQPRPFASIKTACLAERVRLIRFSTSGDYLLTGIANFPRNENDVNMSQSNSEGPFQRPAFSRRFFQFRDDDLDDFDSQRYPHIETPYTQTSEFRFRRALARRDRLYMTEAALERPSNQSREIHNLLSQADEGASTVNSSNGTVINSRELLSQARSYAASVTLETVANRATDALVSGESHRAAGRDAMTRRQILESVLSNMQNETQSESRDNSSEPPPDLSILPQRRTNSVLRAAVRHRPFRQRINAYRSPDSRPERSDNTTPTALELRTILHPELTVPSTADTNRDSNLPMQTSEASSSGSMSNGRSETAGKSTASSSECSRSSKTTHHSSHLSSTNSPGFIYGPSTPREQRTSTKSASTQPPSFRQICPHHENKAMMRRNIRERFRDHIRERNRADSRLKEHDGQRSNDSVGLSNVRRIARRIQTPGPLTRCWSSRRKCSHYRGRLATVSSDDTHREVRRSRVGVHRLSRGMERVRPTQQPLHRHYDVSIFDEELGRPSRNVHAVVNRAIADAFNVRGETAVANNIKNTTHRLQWWDFTRQELPDISNANASVIVPHCKIHNDNSCDLSQDSQLLATFVPSPYGFPDNGVLAIYSLRKHNFGDVLYTKSFGPNAICTSLSPSGDYVVVGLAAKRLHCWHQTSRKVMAQVFRVEKAYAGENSLVQVNSILHDGDNDQRHQVSVNVVKWIPCSGAGIAYGTNKGDLRICVASPTIGEDKSNLTWNQSSNSNGDMYSRYSIDPAQRARLYNDISLMALGIQFPNRRDRTENGLARVARSTQTGEDDDEGVERQSMSTQTEQPVMEASPQGDRGNSDREIDEQEVGVSSVQGIVNGGEQEMEQPIIEEEVNEGNNSVAEDLQEMDSDESRDRETGETV